MTQQSPPQAQTATLSGWRESHPLWNVAVELAQDNEEHRRLYSGISQTGKKPAKSPPYFFCCFVSLEDGVLLHNWGWPGNHYVAQAALELIIHPPNPSTRLCEHTQPNSHNPSGYRLLQDETVLEVHGGDGCIINYVTVFTATKLPLKLVTRVNFRSCIFYQFRKKYFLYSVMNQGPHTCCSLFYHHTTALAPEKKILATSNMC